MSESVTVSEQSPQIRRRHLATKSFAANSTASLMFTPSASAPGRCAVFADNCTAAHAVLSHQVLSKKVPFKQEVAKMGEQAVAQPKLTELCYFLGSVNSDRASSPFTVVRLSTLISMTVIRPALLWY